MQERKKMVFPKPKSVQSETSWKTNRFNRMKFFFLQAKVHKKSIK